MNSSSQSITYIVLESNPFFVVGSATTKSVSSDPHLLSGISKEVGSDNFFWFESLYCCDQVQLRI